VGSKVGSGLAFCLPQKSLIQTY